MTFPTAHSVVYRNEDGEVLGWDTDYGYEPEYCDICGVTHPSSVDCKSYDYSDSDDEDGQSFCDYCERDDSENPDCVCNDDGLTYY